ncbi:uncharacterized protein LOC110166659 isoform X3 [Boleophthalmus pectinirostris]|uniref:uncharacterized protein LOC110166659 isoform X3 n=1 Tax=Boleophthalmus pectinirostris TaxID=150288 RepID=UPI00243117C6|nr:uncharacterized protein LOC110166659 isoform X3 [Boleophthalmus pectinirostris]
MVCRSVQTTFFHFLETVSSVGDNGVMENSYKVFCLITILSYSCFCIAAKTEMNTKSVVIGGEWYPEAYHYQINVTLSEDQLYALTIKKAVWDHAGNYMCETTTGSGVWTMNWKLKITDEQEAGQKSSILVYIIIVICVGIIAVVPLIIFLYKRQRHSNRQHCAQETVNTVYHVEKQHDIYENCLESQVRNSHHIYSN